MNNRIATIALVLLCIVFPAASGAATLSIEPASSVAVPGSTISLELVISGLGAGVAPSVGDFDIDIGFDPFALGLIGVGLGPGLGDVGAGDAIDVSFGQYLPGVVNIAEVSFLTDGELDFMQPDIFVLATLDFMVLGLGAGDTTFVDILAVLSLGDVTGDPIVIDGASGAMITAIVPLPAALWLFVAACGLLGGMPRRPR